MPSSIGKKYKTVIPCHGKDRTMLLWTAVGDPGPQILAWAHAFLVAFNTDDASTSNGTADPHDPHDSESMVYSTAQCVLLSFNTGAGPRCRRCTHQAHTKGNYVSLVSYTIPSFVSYIISLLS